MLKILPNAKPPLRHPGRESRLWHDEVRYTPSIGCTACHDRTVCGGLRVEGRLYDCLHFCCGSPGDCDAVCRNRPDDFVCRVREVGGFEFDNVPRAEVLESPSLPPVIPLLYHGSKRVEGFEAPAVCLPLYSVIERSDGTVRIATRSALANRFGVAASASLILTGTATDQPLERWWSLGSRRRDNIRALVNLGVAMVTTPNYSLFIDQPRWDDLHSLKRIALVHQEFLSEGMPAALHLNARTERDWNRWAEYILARPEVTHVAFEFGTGAGWARRTDWHASQLTGLAKSVGRPLNLILRGGIKALPSMLKAFSKVTVVDTTVFTKTRCRQRAILQPSGAVSWEPSPTQNEESLDRLLAENWHTFARAHEDMLVRDRLATAGVE